MRKNLEIGNGALDTERGPELWRSLEELSRSPEFLEMVEREFPQAASEWADGVSRRRFLQLMSASLALGGLTACTRQPLELIVPYAEQPEQIIPGKPLFFATSMELDGFATGLLIETQMGRPIKIEGSPEHPASLGATDVFAQASVLDLYDPDRNQTVQKLGRISTWRSFAEDTARGLDALEELGGARLRVLTGTVTSPSLAEAIKRLLEKYPKARWHQYQPVGGNRSRIGAQALFGRPVGLRYDLSKAEVIVALGSDFLTQGPGSVRYARDFAAGRRVEPADGSRGSRMNRLYCLESSPTATGTLADHRIPVSQRESDAFALALAAELGVARAPGTGSQNGHLGELVQVVARDLEAHRGRSLVIPGESSPPAVHTLAHAINAELGNVSKTVLVTEPVEAQPVDEAESISELVADMAAGEVDALLILGGNPVYDAPADLDFQGVMQKVTRRIHLSLYRNETSEYCQWVLPEAHFLESWGDSRAFDGTVSLIQPMIEPLYDGRTALETVALLAADEGPATAAGAPTGEELLREHWRAELAAGEGFDRQWRRSLHDGLVSDTALEPLDLAPASGAAEAAAAEIAGADTATGATGSLELAFRPDPTVWDGRFANNGWLQECPKPLTKLTWDNAALVAPALADRLGLENGQVVELIVPGAGTGPGSQILRAPVWIHPGQAPGVVTAPLGYGRTRSGRIGDGCGFDAYRLRTAAAPWNVPGLELMPTSEKYPLSSTQLHSNIEVEGRTAGDRHLIRTATLDHFAHHPEFAQHVGHGIDESLSLYEGWEYEGHAWGLSVDLGACTGCNACVIACQSENNIPIVGKDQVARGREMHWIRIDRYYEGSRDTPRAHHQPVMCMHCEQAPCEVVCPVAATVHSDEGLNDMVYNRCVGTRYCSNNCPYKVRRFNFLKYNDTDSPVLELLRNPDVTVRSRGVMEKCTYCVQRINAARIAARREDRDLRDGEVVTACQQVCPTGAIVFGDINDPESEVTRRKKDKLDYGILSELGTRPRTSYLAKITNPNPLADTAEKTEDHG